MLEFLGKNRSPASSKTIRCMHRILKLRLAEMNNKKMCINHQSVLNLNSFTQGSFEESVFNVLIYFYKVGVDNEKYSSFVRKLISDDFILQRFSQNSIQVDFFRIFIQTNFIANKSPVLFYDEVDSVLLLLLGNSRHFVLRENGIHRCRRTKNFVIRETKI